jgi:hypothetical protein
MLPFFTIGQQFASLALHRLAEHQHHREAKSYLLGPVIGFRSTCLSTFGTPYRNNNNKGLAK